MFKNFFSTKFESRRCIGKYGRVWEDDIRVDRKEKGGNTVLDLSGLI
jgi:hypothetical protein